MSHELAAERHQRDLWLDRIGTAVTIVATLTDDDQRRRDLWLMRIGDQIALVAALSLTADHGLPDHRAAGDLLLRALFRGDRIMTGGQSE